VSAKRKLWIVAAGGCVFSFAVFLSSLPTPPDPVYQGKRLSEYLCVFRWDGIGLGDTPPFEISIVSIAPSQQRDEACQAIRQLGTNALPLIYHWFRAKPSPIDKLLNLARVRWRSGL